MMASNSMPMPPETGVTVVYLVRHGETTANAERRIQGHLDTGLSPTGYEQAAALAAWLSGQRVTFSALYSSDLLRAAQTAGCLAGTLALKPDYVPALREINMGRWQGMLVTEIETAFPGARQHWHEHVDSTSPPGGETLVQVQERISAFYRQTVHKHGGEAIIMVSHGAALAALIAWAQGWGLVETWRRARARMDNTGVTRIDVLMSTGEQRIVLLNSLDHLEQPTTTTAVPVPRPDVIAP